MKKVFPILKFLDDDDIILIVDDDLDIPNDLLELRLREFFEHECSCAISGGTNPKWHLNKSFCGRKYNAITPTSMFMKKMLRWHEKFFCDEVVSTFNDDCLYSLLITMNGF